MESYRRGLFLPLVYVWRIVVGAALFSGAGLVVAQPSPTKVEFLQLEHYKVRQWTGYSAQITAVESAQIRPLVGGRVVQVLFREGQEVERGQPLFVIDPRPFEAALKKAQATLVTAEANARLTAQELSRARDLMKSELISQSVYDEALTSNQVAEASVLQAQSSIMEAELNLEYANIVAPIAGRVGRAELTVGNVVGSGPAAPVLTTIVAHDRVYAEFRVDERTFLNLANVNHGEARMPVRLVTNPNAGGYLEGYVHAFDNHLDATSGTIRTRAIFSNRDHRLVPGMYADVHLGSAQAQDTLLIPESAIGTNQDRKYVFVIDAEDTAQYREITLGDQHRSLRVVENGLQAGERIVINGIARLRPNMPVEPVAGKIVTDIASIQF